MPMALQGGSASAIGITLADVFPDNNILSCCVRVGGGCVLDMTQLLCKVLVLPLDLIQDCLTAQPAEYYIPMHHVHLSPTPFTCTGQPVLIMFT